MYIYIYTTLHCYIFREEYIQFTQKESHWDNNHFYYNGTSLINLNQKDNLDNRRQLYTKTSTYSSKKKRGIKKLVTGSLPEMNFLKIHRRDQ